MKIGLTGGIGCGKSTVVAIFKAAGWRTVETDALVRELLSEDAEVRAALRERWGPAVFEVDAAVDREADAKVDRKAVAMRVFADANELRWLEELLHPRVRAAWLARMEAEPESSWLIEIPLLFEKRLETYFDFTVCVESSPAVVDCRMRKRGYTEAEIEQRRARQMSLEEKIRRADFVISNSGSLEFLKSQCARVMTL